MDYAVLKTLEREELEELVPEGFTFKRRPWRHQLASFLAVVANEGFNVWLDLGTGKTKVAIDSVRFLEEFVLRRKARIFVVCLNSAVENWGDEFELNSDMNVTLMRAYTDPISTSTEKRFQMLQGYGAYIISYEGLRSMLTEKETRTFYSQRTEQKTTRNLLAPSTRLIRKFVSFKWDAIITDESHKIKNIQSLNYKLINRISKDINFRLNLTGTPYGKDYLGLWPQYFIVDRGETFCYPYSKWRQDHFEDVGKYGPDWRVTPEGKERIETDMWNKAIRVSEAEVKDMPPKVYREVYFDLTKEQRESYQNAMKKAGEHSNATNRSMIFRQICSGIIVNSNYRFKTNPKLKLLEELLESVVDEDKVVIFHEFIMEAELIHSLLKSMKVKFCQLNGQVKDKYKQIKTFETKDNYRVLTAHPYSGGSSINLNVARYCFFFSNNHSPIERQQCEKRIHRGEIKRTRFYYDLLAKGTIEVGIHKALKANVNAFEEVMNRDEYREFLEGNFREQRR